MAEQPVLQRFQQQAVRHPIPIHGLHQEVRQLQLQDSLQETIPLQLRMRTVV